MPKFREAIKEHLPVELRSEVIPKGFKRIGDLMILRSAQEIPKEVGIAALNAFPWCRGVFQQLNTLGENRRPVFRHLAGSKSTETIHKENGVTYILDAEKITFSGGNSFLRKRLVTLVQEGENLLDMFAAVGNLSLQPIVHKRVDYLLIERDPITFRYLERTLQANGLDISKIRNMDCRNMDIENWADRIFMGYHGITQDHLTPAVRSLKSEGYIHLHPLEKKENLEYRQQTISDMLTELGCRIERIEIHKVKKYSPGLQHYEFIYKISKI